MAETVSESAAAGDHARPGDACGTTCAAPSGGRWSAATRRCAWSRSRCSPTGTCCSRTCRAPARRSSPAPSPAPSSLDTARIQGTPDLLPSDVTGASLFEPAAPPLRRGPGVHERPAGRRDQPGHAAHPVRAAGGDAGAPGHDRGHDPPRCRTRSSSWRPRTPSSSRARSRSRRPSSTGSCCAPGSATPTPPASARSPAATRRRRSPSTRSSPSSTANGCWPSATGSARSASPTRSRRYIVELVRATRAPPRHRPRRQPARDRRAVPRRAGRGGPRGPRVRHARRRQGHRAGRAGPPADRRPRPDASTAPAPTPCWQRSWPRSPSRPCSPAEARRDGEPALPEER